ncbi:MAG: integrase core domain-containing protein [Methyloceanibacter sp.]
MHDIIQWPSRLDLWAYANDGTLDFSRPGKPTNNGFIEAINRKFRRNLRTPAV